MRRHRSDVAGRRRVRHGSGQTDLGRSTMRSPARTGRLRRPQQEPPRQEHQLPRGPNSRPHVPQIHLRPFGRVRGGRLPLALYVHEPPRLGVGATLRGRAEADEHPLARLKLRALAFIAVFVALGTAGAAPAARAPSSAEKPAIRQAIFDDIAVNAHPRRPVITRIRVSSITLQRHRYRKFARVDLDDPTKAGPAYALLGYFVASISGWRVLDLGSSEVGCGEPAQAFGGRRRAVLRDLKLDCP